MTGDEIRQAVTYPQWCEANGCTHGHCPDECQHPQPRWHQGQMVCGRCLVKFGEVVEVVPCNLENCGGGIDGLSDAIVWIGANRVPPWPQREELGRQMTIDQIDALAPGREADKLFAEHVLGWTGFYHEEFAGIVGFPPKDRRWEMLLAYSTDSDTALTAMDEFVRSSDGSWTVSSVRDGYEVSIANDMGLYVHVKADTLALAMIRCCLKAAMGGEQ